MGYVKRSIEELNLIDDFLFTELMLNKESAENLAKIIIERATGFKVDNLEIEYQKVVNGLDTNLHGIRMDMAVSEQAAAEETCSIGEILGESEVSIGEKKNLKGKKELVRLFDIEPNNGNRDELAKRSRYCQALTDVKLLEAGTDYNKMPELWSIWILPYDPFDRNQMIYFVKNVVEGFEEIAYNDGIRKVFLYTGGELGGNEKLKSLLTYMKTSTKENAVDEDLVRLHSSVEQVKRSREIGVKYMRMQEVMEQMQRKSLEEGIEIGEKKGIEIGEKKGMEIGEKRGIELGEERNSKLTSILLKEKRYSELGRAAEDEEYRKELYQKYGIE